MQLHQMVSGIDLNCPGVWFFSAKKHNELKATDDNAINEAMNAISPLDAAIVRIIMRMFSLCRLILAMRKMRNIRPVSYTHLTLPTICSV